MQASWSHGFLNFFYFFHLFIFYWRIISLQNFVVFCQTSTWISHRYAYIPSLSNLPPILGQIPKLGNLLYPRTLLTEQEFLQYNCSAVCWSSAQWLCGGVYDDFLQEDLCHTLCDPGLLYPEPLPLQQATVDPCLCKRYSNTQRHVWLSLCGVSGSWCAQGFVWSQWASLSGVGLDSKHDFALPAILLELLFCLDNGACFFGGIQYSAVNGCSTVSCKFGVLTGEDEHTSFYFTTLISSQNDQLSFLNLDLGSMKHVLCLLEDEFQPWVT